MSDWVVPLSDVRLAEAEIAAVADTYRRGWISQGPLVAEFEAAFSRFLGGREAVAVSSGTAALQLIAAVSDLGAGQEIVVPSLTFAATAAAVVHAGATPVFADIDAADRPWLGVRTVEPLLSSRTRAIVTMSYGGDPGEARALRSLADARGLLLVEDAAHGLGATAGGRACGTIGGLAAFSFFANKNLPLGEGGMLVCEAAEQAARARRLRSHGLTSGTWQRHTEAAGEYEVAEPGFNFRLDEPRAALGLRLLARLEGDNRRRRAIAEAYESALAGRDDIAPASRARPGISSAWHIYPVVLGEGVDRAALRRRLHAAGVQTSIHYPPLHQSAAFRRWADGPLPRTELYAARTLTLPMFPHLTSNQQQHVLERLFSDLDRNGQTQ